jgi:hypothetical protein
MTGSRFIAGRELRLWWHGVCLALLAGPVSGPLSGECARRV